MLQRLSRAYREAFSGLPRSIWLLAAGTLVNRSGTMVLPFMSLYLTAKLGFSAVEAGRILGLYGIGAIAGAYLGGWLSDRIGAVRVQTLSLLGAGAGFLVLGALTGRAAISTAVLLLSIVAECFRPALFTAIAQHSPLEVRTRSFALIRLAVNLGMSVGPAVGGILAVHHYHWLFVADALTCWAAAAMLWATLGRHATARPAARTSLSLPTGSPWRDRPYLAFLLLAVVLGTVFFQLLSTIPLYLRESYGLPESKIGVLLALNAVIIVGFEMVLLRSIEHLDHLRVVGLGCFLVCAGFGLMPFGRGVAYAAFTIVVWTLGEMLTLPLANAVASHRADSGQAGRYLGAYSLAFSVAFVLAPLIGTGIYQRLGPDVLWHAVTGVGVLLWLGFAALSHTMRAGENESPRN
jgi:MFS family permease